MKILHDSALMEQYLNSAPYTDYFREPCHRADAAPASLPAPNRTVGSQPDSLKRYTQIREFDAGEIILEQDSKPEFLYLMLSGRCSVRVLLANGKSVILQTMKAPGLIGEVELIRDVSSFTVQTLEKSRMLAIQLKQTKTYLLEDPYFLRRLCFDLIAKERTEALSLIHTFGYPLENRLAKFILDNSQETCFYIKKIQISESLGVSYRHVGTVMSDFVKKEYLEKHGLVYSIKNKKALSDLARELETPEFVTGNVGYL